ncbi:MAG: ArsA family ATPase, partial [Candidatus Dormibacteraceae bacterium]
AMMWIKRYAEAGEHDVVVVDCAPTGETLQLLMFPEAARWWLDKVYPWERRAMKLARPLLQPILDGPLPTDEIFNSVRDLLLDIEAIKDVLVNTELSSVRLVLNLEKMVVKEAKRAYTYLSLFGYQTDAVVVNRCLPSTLRDPFFQGWQELQKRYSEEVQNSFSPLPILQAPLFPQEVVGVGRLRELAQAIYGEQDPAVQLYRGKPQQIEKVGEEYVLTLQIPLVSKGEVTIDRSGGEISITVGNYRREVSLPRTLMARETLGATLEEGELRVRFGEKALAEV